MFIIQHFLSYFLCACEIFARELLIFQYIFNCSPKSICQNILFLWYVRKNDHINHIFKRNISSPISRRWTRFFEKFSTSLGCGICNTSFSFSSNCWSLILEAHHYHYCFHIPLGQIKWSIILHHNNKQRNTEQSLLIVV